MKMKSRLSFSNSPLMAAKKTCLSLLSALLVLSLFSCDPDDENEQDKSPKWLQSLGFSVSVEKQKTSTRSDMASAGDESFTFTIGENNDCEITCLVTDMEGNTSVSPTRGTPVGTTVPYKLDGTIPVIGEVTNSIESMYGTDGIAITAYRKDKDDNVSLLTPNSDYPAETAGNVAEFKNLKYTYAATAFDGEGSWTTASNINGYYWYETEKLRFYAAAPATLVPATLAPNYEYPTAGKASFSYTVPADNANQKDVLIGATDFLTRPTLIKDKPYSMEVEIPTYHALCAVRFVIDNRELGTAPNYTQRSKEFKLTSITLTNLKTGGTCTYTYNSSSSAKSADCIEWDLTSSSTGDYFCNFGTSGSGLPIAKTNTTYNLHSADGSASGTQLTNVFLLVPQDLAEDCKVEFNYTYDAYEYSTSGVQTIVPEACTISGQLVGSGATKDSGGAYTSYGSWEPGKMYTYVISSKYIKRKGVLYKIDGTINYDSGNKGAPNDDASWWSITDFASETGLTYARGHNSPGAFSIDVSDIKYIELSWTDQTKKFVTNTASYVTAAHIWLEGDLLTGGYYRNGLTGTSGHNGTGLDHNNNPAKTVVGYSYAGNGNTPTDYTDVYMYEKLIKASPGSYSDGVNYSHKWVFDVSAYSTIKIPAYYYNAQTGGGSCLWDLTNFKVTALEFMDW